MRQWDKRKVCKLNLLRYWCLMNSGNQSFKIIVKIYYLCKNQSHRQILGKNIKSVNLSALLCSLSPFLNIILLIGILVLYDSLPFKYSTFYILASLLENRFSSQDFNPRLLLHLNGAIWLVLNNRRWMKMMHIISWPRHLKNEYAFSLSFAIYWLDIKVWSNLEYNRAAGSWSSNSSMNGSWPFPRLYPLTWNYLGYLHYRGKKNDYIEDYIWNSAVCSPKAFNFSGSKGINSKTPFS